MMTAHKHAAAMLLYAQDAAETDTPWERWERRQEGLEDFHPLRSNPHFDENVEYRRKPRTIRIGERDVPEPMRVAPAMGSTYYIVDYSYAEHNAYHHWQNDEYDNIMLQSGLCHATEKAAIAHAEALILISGGTL
jgi:hypothetical protein